MDPSELDLPKGSIAVAVTHVMELPGFLPVREGSLLLLAGDRTPAWDGVASEFTGRVMQLGDATAQLGDHHVVTTRLVFRSAVVRQRLPLEAADLTFADWVEPLLSDVERARRSEALEETRAAGASASVTVVAGTSLIPGGLWHDADRDALTEDALDSCLRFLNEYVVGLATATGDARLSPFARGDLPVLCPVIMEAVGLPDRHGWTFVRTIHDVLPTGTRHRVLSPDVLEGAARFAIAGRRGDEPLFLFYELFHAAQAAMLRQQFAQGVAVLGTATESMIDTVLREGLSLEGYSEQDVEKVLKSPFVRRVPDHLGRLTHTHLDRTDPSNSLGRWWSEAYGVRNRVVHEGFRPTRHETKRALDATVALLEELSNGLSSNAATLGLGQRLRISPPIP